MNTHEDLPISSATVPAEAFGLEPLLDVTELAAYLGVPECASPRASRPDLDGVVEAMRAVALSCHVC